MDAVAIVTFICWYFNKRLNPMWFVVSDNMTDVTVATLYKLEKGSFRYRENLQNLKTAKSIASCLVMRVNGKIKKLTRPLNTGILLSFLN